MRERRVNETKLLTLKGIALSKYGSCTRFANEMGWNRSKASRILNGKQSPNMQDIKQLTDKMEIPKDAIVPIFFGTMFTE